MINPDWSKWIQRAILKHFINNLSGYTVLSETEDVDKDDLEKWFEVRVDITYQHLQGNQYEVTVPVNILVMSAKEKQIYNAKILSGLVASKFTDISVLNDLNVFQFCLRLKDKVEDTYYGETEAQANMEQATVEGTYEAFII